MQEDRAIAISKLVELTEHHGMRHYVFGYLSALCETEQLENAVHAAYGFMESLNEQAPHVELIRWEGGHDPRG